MDVCNAWNPLYSGVPKTPNSIHRACCCDGFVRRHNCVDAAGRRFYDPATTFRKTKTGRNRAGPISFRGRVGRAKRVPPKTFGKWWDSRCSAHPTACPASNIDRPCAIEDITRETLARFAPDIPVKTIYSERAARFTMLVKTAASARRKRLLVAFCQHFARSGQLQHRRKLGKFAIDLLQQLDGRVHARADAREPLLPGGTLHP